MKKIFTLSFLILLFVNGFAQVPGNDLCSGATTLINTIGSSGTNASATTTGDPSPGCGFTIKAPVWYKFTILTAGSITATVTHGSIRWAGVTIYSGACGSLTELSCNEAGTNTGNPSTTASCLAAGTYYILVWDDGGTNGTFTITATSASGIGPPANDACANATNMGTISTTANSSGTNICASADGTYSGCHSPTENVWYKFTVPAGGGSYAISVAGGTITSPCISVNSGTCGSQTEIICNYGSGSTSSVSANCLVAGTYYIAIDDDFGTEGTFTVTVTQTSAGITVANDACASAINVGTISTTTTVAGYNNCATADGSYSGCVSPRYNVWYKFTVPAGGGNYAVSVTAGTMVDPSISVNSGTCGSLTEIACTYGSTSTASVTASCLTAGTYYVAVDDDFGTEGTFSLTVTQISAGITVANDACSAAISLGTVSSTTTTAGNNLCATADESSSSCFTFSKNIWYTFTVPSGGGTYSIAVNGGTIYEPDVAVFMGSCGSLTPIACNAYCSGSGTTTQVTTTTSCLAPGTYYIAVDDDASSCSGTMGTFSLTVTQTSVGGPPSNDLCTSPVTLVTGSAIAGTNKCASSYSDPDPDCYTPATAATVWYTYTPTTSGNATFNLTPGNIKWPAMALYTGSCGAFTEVGCVSATAVSTIASMSASCLSAGTTYYIMVDNNGHNNFATGTFSITTTFTTVASGPSNDCCTNPANIPSLNGTCNGGYTTVGATYDQYEFGCFNNTTNSHNVWFSFVAQGPNATINVNGGASFNPEVSIFTASNLCSVSTATGIGCATATGASVTVSNSQSLVTGQTYYIMVDNNQTGTPGSFSICVNNTVAPPSPGQDCKTGLQVCNSSSLGGNAAGTGSVTDLNSTTQGCLSGGEHQSNWFIVTINTGGTLTMTISPTVSGDDYDFALWGPTTTCPISSAPISCNFSATSSPPQTGLTSTVSATTSQGAGGTPWNSPANVTTGSTYILLVDNFSATTEPFTLNWGGSAVLSCNPVIILPVELLNFTATLNGEEVDLKWSTASEINNVYFTIERSADGKNFEEFARLNSAGNTTQTLNYSTIDYKPLPGISYYRLNQTDANGISKQLSIQSVININNDGMFTVVPNPTDGVVNITYSCNVATVGTLKLYDSNGGLVLSKDFACATGKNTSQLDLESLTPGIYLITYNTGGKFYRTKLMKK